MDSFNATPSLSSDNLPIVITGMHRSGTSMTASFLQALGVNVGHDLMVGDLNNQPGYFEDWDFVNLHREIFQASCAPREPGWVEVGWTESETLNEEIVRRFIPRARHLIDTRRNLPVWGWKDPRTTLMLPFWEVLLPQVRFVFVYRAPWDVVDSLYRAGHEVFNEHPEFALRIWIHYNRQLLEFYRAHPHRCLLVNTNVLSSHLPEFTRALSQKLDLPLNAEQPAEKLAALFAPQLLKHLPPEHPMVSLFHAHFPEAIELLHELNTLADIPGEFNRPPQSAQLACAKLHHQRGASLRSRFATEENEKKLRQRINEQDEAFAQLSEERTRLASEIDQLKEERGSLTLELNQLTEERNRLSQGLSERDHDIQAILSSTSWRLSAPFRHVVSQWRAFSRNEKEQA